MKKYGLRNSLLTAQMPTASSATFCSGGVESVEATAGLIYNRRVLSGEFPVICRHLVNDLIKLGIWNSEMKHSIMRGGGSIQHIKEIPENIRRVYKTVWELSQKIILEQAADRGRFIDQSQSTNVFFESPTVSKLTSAAFFAFEKGLKTSNYYVRTRPVADAIKFTVPKSPDLKKGVKSDNNVEAEEECVNCSA